MVYKIYLSGARGLFVCGGADDVCGGGSVDGVRRVTG